MEDASATAQEKEEYREIISRRARVLQTMVASFYDLSRLEAGEYPLHPEPVSLYDIPVSYTHLDVYKRQARVHSSKSPAG